MLKSTTAQEEASSVGRHRVSRSGVDMNIILRYLIALCGSTYYEVIQGLLVLVWE